jgi:hypothetical protein
MSLINEREDIMKVPHGTLVNEPDGLAIQDTTLGREKEKVSLKDSPTWMSKGSS